MKVLITDPLNRIPFDVYNILERNHPDLGILLLGTGDALYRAKARLVYGKNIETLRKDSYAHFEADLNRIVAEHRAEDLVYVPLEEDTTRLFYRYIENNSPSNLHYNLPEHSQFEIARDKMALSSFCAAQGIPAPAEFTGQDLAALRESPVPIIAKPRHGSGSVGIFRIDTTEQLEALDRLGDTYLFQERLSVEHGVRGAFYLFDRGKLVSCYAHRRILTYPRQGGVTTYSRIDNDPEVLKAGRNLLEALDWSGLAMVELLYDERDRVWKTIEVNPRGWGSFLLSEFSGADFLRGYINTALGESPRKTALRDDVAIRWLVPYGIADWIRSWFRSASEDTCYNSFTYSRPGRSLAFLVAGLFDPSKLIKAMRKAFGR